MTNRIFGIIGWLGTAFVLAAIAIWAATRTSFNLPAQWDQYRYYLAWAGLVCVLIYMASQWRDIAGMFDRRQARYGTLAATSVLIVLAILVAVNYIGKQQNKRWDLTENKQFSLSDQSRNVAAKLDAPVQIMGFMPPADQPVAVNTFRDLLQEYANLSNQISLELVDVDRNPSVASQNEVRSYGEIVMRHKGRTERVTSTTEQDVTNALIKVVSGEARTIYFTQGHGEKDPASSEATGYMSAAESLKRENYTVEKVVLAQQGAVPDNATMVVVAGPRVDFLPGEIETLEEVPGEVRASCCSSSMRRDPTSRRCPNLAGAGQQMGHRRRQQSRPRPDRHGSVVRRRSGDAGRGQLPVAPDYVAARRHDGLPGRALRDAGQRRQRRPDGANNRRDELTQLGRVRPQEPLRAPAADPRRRGRRQTGTHLHRGGGVGANHRSRPHRSQ